jgi:hypothetical protein
MDLTPEHLSYKKQIGLYKGSPVYECATTGGFHIIVGRKGNELHTFGTGSHRAIARHIARKREPELVITEMSKADEVPLEAFGHLVPGYEALTDRFNAREKEGR